MRFLKNKKNHNTLLKKNFFLEIIEAAQLAVQFFILIVKPGYYPY